MKDSVKAVGIGIVVLGVLGWLYAVANILMVMLGSEMWVEMSREFEREFGAEAARAMVMGSQWAGILFNIVGSSLMLFGGLQMMRHKSWGLSVTACILAMLPCWGCCCIGLPLGGFGLYLLFNDEIKRSFNPVA
jgi:hypothetical protein